MKHNLMGFKPVDSIPTTRGRGSKGGSIYDGILHEAVEKGGIYCCQIGDVKRATNLANQLRRIINQKNLPLVVAIRKDALYLYKEEADA